MLRDEFTSVLEVRSVEALRSEVLRFTRWLGFDLMGAILVVDKAVDDADFFAVDNMPDVYRRTTDNRENWRRDPVAQHCKHNSTPIIWDQRTYVKQGVGDKWEAQAAFGYRAGMAMALHLPNGKHFIFGVDRDQPLPAHSGERARLAGDLLLFATYAQDCAERLLAPRQVFDEDLSRLSARELEALRWTMEGKTAWELGAILGISEQTAARHLNNATQKLGCVNKLQAVVKALRLGLIQ